MKAVILLLLPVLVIAAPEKRFVLDDLLKLINLETIKQDLQLLINITGSDPTEQACEQAGHQYLSGLLDHAVPLLCHSFQELIHHFHIVPATTTVAPGKRYVLGTLSNLIDTDPIKKELQLLTDLIGSDPTEQACEQAVRQYLVQIPTGLLEHRLLCHSFQELIQHFHIVPTTGKRYIVDTLSNLINTDPIKKELQLLTDLIGSDPTEQACEQAVRQYLVQIPTGLLEHRLLCHSFQELIQHFHIVPTTGKRYIVDTLTNLIDIDTLKMHLQKLVDLIGSDPTEQVCEQAGHQYLSGLLDHAVPLICHSFQELIQHFHIVPTTEKRYIVDTLTNLIDIGTLKMHLQKLVDLIGSDPTEQACEQAGHQYFKGLLDHAVPLICHSFQELVLHFHIVPVTATPPSTT